MCRGSDDGPPVRCGAEKEARACGFTPIHWAVRADSGLGVMALAEAGADLEAKDPDGATALHFAATHRRDSAGMSLIEEGANRKAKYAAGKTPSQLVSREEEDDEFYFMLHGRQVRR